MDQELLMKQIVEEVMKSLNSNNGSSNTTTAKTTAGNKVDASSYPLGEKIPEKILSPTGKKLSDMKFEEIINGKLVYDDMRISPETLEMQAQVADSIGRDAFARNLRRAAELISVPDERILEIYNALRPYRSTKQELFDIADELQNKYNCNINATFIREAAEVYEKRGRLKKD